MDINNFMAATINDLPDEIIVHIFSYLPLVCRKNARQTCRRLYILSYTPSLIRGDVIQVATLDDLNKVRTYSGYINLRVKKVGYSSAKSKFWQKHGADIKSIELYALDVNSPNLGFIFKNCPNVEHVVLSAYDIKHHPVKLKSRNNAQTHAVEIQLPKLLSLQLIKISNLDLLTILTDHAPKLCKFAFNSNYSRSYDWSQIVAVIQRQSTVMKEIDLSNCFIPDDVLERILNAVGPQLTGLHLQSAISLTPAIQTVITSKLVNLKELDISRSCFHNQSVYHVTAALNKLTMISLLGLQTLRDSEFQAISRLDNLTAIDLSSCKVVTITDLVETFGIIRRSKLNDLRLNYLRCVNDNVLCRICPMLPNLRYFSLRGCRKFSARGFKAICRYNKKLRCLSLRHCTGISSLGRKTPCVSDIKGLVHLDLFACGEILGSSIRAMRLLELETVDLSYVKVARKDLNGMIEGCPTLYHIIDVSDGRLDEVMFGGDRVAGMYHHGMSIFEAHSFYYS